MSKQKTRKVAVKRFKVTKTGKVKRRHSQTSHLARKDSASAKTRKKREQNVEGKFAKKIKKMLRSK